MKNRKWKEQPRPVRYRTLRNGIGERECHEIRIALTMLFEDEGRVVMDQMIRNACYDAADMADLRIAGRIAAMAHGTKAKIGPVLACEIMDAISRLWDECEADAELSDSRQTPVQIARA